MTDNYDVIIIGSGLSGLTCANILSKNGYNVCVVEKNTIPGGCLQTFKRKNVTFDTGIHYVGSLDEGQRLNKLFKYLGIMSDLKIRKLDVAGFDRFRQKDLEFSYASGFTNFIDTLSTTFPSEREAISSFTNQIKKISDSISLYNLQPSINKGQSFLDKLEYGGTWEYITKLTPNRELQEALTALNSLYAGSKEGSFLFLHALIYNHYIESAYRFIGGSSQITNLLLNKLKEHGGTFLNNHKAEKFIFNDRDISHLITNNGRELRAKYFISSIHPQNTLKMVEPGKLRKSYFNRVSQAKNTISSFALYLVLKDKSVPYMNYNQYVYETDDLWTRNTSDSVIWPEGYAIYPVADTKDTSYTRGLSVLTMMDYNEVKKWENSSVEMRDKSYYEFKEEKANQLIHAIGRQFPILKNNIISYYTSSPLTLRDYLGSPEGSMYGIERNYSNPMESFVFPKTRIPNLILSGQSTSIHGMLGVSIGALLSCSELCSLNKLLEEINNV